MSYPHTVKHRGILPQNQQNAAFVHGMVDPSLNGRMKEPNKAPYKQNKDKTDRIEAHEAVYGFVSKTRSNFQHADAMTVVSRFNGIVPRNGSNTTETYADCIRSIEALEDEIEFRGVSKLPMGKDPIFSHASDASVTVQGTATTFYTKGNCVLPGTLVRFELPRPKPANSEDRAEFHPLRSIEKMDEGVIRPDLVPVEDFDIEPQLQEGGRLHTLLKSCVRAKYREEADVPLVIQSLVNSVDWGLGLGSESDINSENSYTEALRHIYMHHEFPDGTPWQRKMITILGFLEAAKDDLSGTRLLKSWVKTLNAGKNTFWLQERKIVGRVIACHPKRYSSMGIVYG